MMMMMMMVMMMMMTMTMTTMIELMVVNLHQLPTRLYQCRTPDDDCRVDGGGDYGDRPLTTERPCSCLSKHTRVYIRGGRGEEGEEGEGVLERGKVRIKVGLGWGQLEGARK